VAEDALKLVFVICRVDEKGVSGYSSSAGISELLEEFDLDGNS